MGIKGLFLESDIQLATESENLQYKIKFQKIKAHVFVVMAVHLTSFSDVELAIETLNSRRNYKYLY